MVPERPGPNVGLRPPNASRHPTRMLRRLRAPRRSMSLGAIVAVAFLAISAVPATAADFPAKDSLYHSYS